MMRYKFIIIFISSLFGFINLIGQNELSSKKQDFDFWIGEWDVYKIGTDSLLGHSSIKPILNHESIEETYISAQTNYKGKSFNQYIPSLQRWEQYYVDNTGYQLHLKGGLVDSIMVLSDCKGTNFPCNTIFWQVLEDGSVGQKWEQTNQGNTKSILFHGQYRRQGTNLKVQPAFAILSDYPTVRDLTIHPNGKEAYVTIQSTLGEVSQIAVLREVQGMWQEPQLVNFNTQHNYLEPYFSPDGRRLYFASNRPIDSKLVETKDYDIWYVERDADTMKWSEPIRLDTVVNSAYDEFYPAMVESGNLYFTRSYPETKGKDDIFFADWNGAAFETPAPMGESINSEGYEFNAYVSPDESFMIFTGYARADGKGSGDLYWSRNESNSVWTVAKPLVSANSKAMDYCPFVDMNENQLYFTSRRSSVDSKSFNHLYLVQKEILRYENGWSRIYRMDIDLDELSGK